VLRVGIGETVEDELSRSLRPDPAAYKAGQRLGGATMKGKVCAALKQKRAEAITGERRDAYDVAISMVQEIQP
jgi:hypothetical protein